MNINSLDLNLLRSLEALLEEASVSRAASRVALSQPAMSHTLRRLRILLRDPLLVRLGARMQLTSRAERLRDPVRDVLARARDLLVSDAFDPTSSTRTFRLLVSDYAADLVLPPMLLRIRAEAPRVTVRVQPERRDTDPLQLAGTLDVAVSCVPNSFKGYYQQRLFTDRDALVVRRGHPRAKSLSRAQEFLNLGQVAVIGSEHREDPVDTWLAQEGCQRHIAVTVPHYLQALHIVARSDLAAVIPERLVRACAKALKLDVLAVPLEVGTFDEYLLHPATTHADPGCVWFRRLVCDVTQGFEPLGSQLAARRSRS